MVVEEEEEVVVGGLAECSATQHSDLPCSTCLSVRVLVCVYEAE